MGQECCQKYIHVVLFSLMYIQIVYYLDVGQLQNVIQIANQTMEGDLVKQLLQDLLKFGSAFAPLIYDVSLDENCETLVNRCKSLWRFVDENPNLAKITVSFLALLNITNVLFTGVL